MKERNFLTIILIVFSNILGRVVGQGCSTTDGNYYYVAEIELSSANETSSNCSYSERTSIGRFLDASFDSVVTAGSLIGKMTLDTDVCETPLPKVYKCCSWDYKNCGTSSWCNSMEHNCEGSCGGVYINPNETTKCKGLWSSCTSNGECCGNSDCFLHSTGWQGCEPLFHGLTTVVKDVGCCSYDLKTCSKSSYCNLNSARCTTSCGGFFINLNTSMSTCLPRYTRCNSTKDCCEFAVCGTVKEGYKQCNIPSTFSARRGLRSGSQDYHKDSLLDVHDQNEPETNSHDAYQLDKHFDRELIILKPLSWVYKGSGRCKLCPNDNNDGRDLRAIEGLKLVEELSDNALLSTRRNLAGNLFTTVEDELKHNLDDYLTSALLKMYGSDPASCLNGVKARVRVQISQALAPVKVCNTSTPV